MAGEIPTPGNFILKPEHTEYEKGNKARMREMIFSKGQVSSCQNQGWYLAFLIIFLFFLLRHRTLQSIKRLGADGLWSAQWKQQSAAGLLGSPVI